MQPNYISVGQIFGGPGRLTVPLFQRPYVWSKEEQWLPLWQDVSDLLDRILKSGGNSPIASHFLGTVVLEQKPNAIGTLPRREIIDGQQRLTTLQVLLKAAEHELKARTPDAAEGDALHLQAATQQIALMCENQAQVVVEERFKVWPTNEDRAAFQTVMLSDGTAVHLPHAGQLGSAYSFFRESISKHLSQNGFTLAERSKGIAAGLRDYVKLIVLDLDASDEPQAIFETLNAHGTPLLPSDLIKNWLLWEASKQELDPTPLYLDYWKQFDGDQAYWRQKVGVGHAARPRVDTFLQNWIAKETTEQVSAKHLYDRFLTHMDQLRVTSPNGKVDVRVVMETIQRNAKHFRRIDQPSSNSRFDVFLRRLGTMDIVVFHPVLLALLDRFRDQPKSEGMVIAPIVSALESYLVRRMVCGYQTRGYGGLSIDLLRAIASETDDFALLSATTKVLRGTYGSTDWWPDDNFFMNSWCGKRFYNVLRRERVVMLLRAIEEQYLAENKFSEPVLHFDFSKLQIEHVLPQKWQDHWPLAPDISADAREVALHGIGNLTLLSGALNPALSNAPWECAVGMSKRSGLAQHSKLEMNQKLMQYSHWDESAIKKRALELFDVAKKVWEPCPQVGPTVAVNGGVNA
jgi:Protein of unknown function DUF262/Protein of unknown function (DUF1524)